MNKKSLIIIFIFILSPYKLLFSSQNPITCSTCGQNIINKISTAIIRIQEPLSPGAWNNRTNTSSQYNCLKRDAEAYKECGLPLQDGSEFYLNARIFVNNNEKKITDSSYAFDACHFFNVSIQRNNKKTDLPITIENELYNATLSWPEDFDSNAERKWGLENYPKIQASSQISSNKTLKTPSISSNEKTINTEKNQKYFLFIMLLSSWAWFLYKTYQKN